MAPQLPAAIEAILEGFCGSDPGRSVAFEAYYPFKFTAAVRGDVPRPAASVIKTALVMAIHQRAARGEVDLERRVEVSRFPSTRYVSVLAAFDPGHALSVREMCRLALITSDNPLAVHLQGLAGFDAVNALLEELGCAPVCRMAAGFSEAELGAPNRANVLTATAALRLLHTAWTDPLYADVAASLRNNLRGQRIPGQLPEHLTVMHKTGSLQGVANDVGIVFNNEIAFGLAFLCDCQPDTILTSTEIGRCALDIFDRIRAAMSALARDRDG